MLKTKRTPRTPEQIQSTKDQVSAILARKPVSADTTRVSEPFSMDGVIDVHGKLHTDLNEKNPDTVAEEKSEEAWGKLDTTIRGLGKTATSNVNVMQIPVEQIPSETAVPVIHAGVS